MAGWGIVNYALPLNLWSLVILAAGMVLFLLAVRRPKQLYLLALSIIAVVVGSSFLFRGQTWYLPAVDPLLSVVVSVLTAGFFWIASRKVIEAASAKPAHSLDALVGEKGEAKTYISKDGSVQVAGELWSARSEQPIPLGSRVRVLRRDGFILVVEQVS